MEAHWRGRPTYLFSRLSKPVWTRCSKLLGIEISGFFFFFENIFSDDSDFPCSKFLPVCRPFLWVSLLLLFIFLFCLAPRQWKIHKQQTMATATAATTTTVTTTSSRSDLTHTHTCTDTGTHTHTYQRTRLGNCAWIVVQIEIRNRFTSRSGGQHISLLDNSTSNLGSKKYKLREIIADARNRGGVYRDYWRWNGIR